jgi:seryl-tRNA synthetase
MTALKEKSKALEEKIAPLEAQIDALASKVPNPTLDSTPVGKDESENQIVKTQGEPTKFTFTPKDHITLGKELDIIDLDRAARMSGARFYYLKNEGALLELALIHFVMQKLASKGFSAVVPPVLVKEPAMYATGFFPADKNEIYEVNADEDKLYLIGTSEVPLAMLHYDEILNEYELPKRYCGFSPCFRREAGSYGKDTAGIIRVHQFNKVEMFSFTSPEKSEEEHEFMVSIEEEIFSDLGLPYQKILMCTGDMGVPAAKKYDIEAWIPTQEKYREVTSCSNCTDFQARRGKMRFKDEKGQKAYVHTLNGTAIALPRAIVAILENYQNEDGTVTIPEVLRPLMGGISKIEKKQ